MMTRVVRVTVFGTWLTTIVLLASTAMAGTVYVDDNAPADPAPGDPAVSDPAENGTAAHPFDAIQEAIDAAVAGDTVELADGTYTGLGNKDLDFAGKPITVRSASGDPGQCIIDCQGAGRGFYFHSGEGADSVVFGVTITKGDARSSVNAANQGGGVYLASSSPTLGQCVISGNSAQNGGGVYCGSGCPSFVDCTIRGNMAKSPSSQVLVLGLGGGLYLGDGATLKNCDVTENAADHRGGGVYCATVGSERPLLTQCRIVGNTAIGLGGGVCCTYSDAALIDCVVSGNEGVSGGGGVYSNNSHPTLANCYIGGNHAFDGGGVGCLIGGLTATNCAIVGNSADYAGGMALSYCDAILTNCTLSRNSADRAGGLSCWESEPTLNNCILWGDTPDEISVSSGRPIVNYCDIQGGWEGVNIDVDPLFVDPDGADNDLSSWADNDFRLKAGSPAIDAGNNELVPADVADLDADGDTTETTPVDLGGSARYFDDVTTPDTGAGGPPVADMGAYEYAPGAGGGLPGIAPVAPPGIGACPFLSNLILTLTLIGLGRSCREPRHRRA